VLLLLLQQKLPNKKPLTNLFNKLFWWPKPVQLPTNIWAMPPLLWTPMLMPDPNRFTSQLMRRETLPSKFHQLINLISSTVLPLSLSERLSVMTLSSQSERRTDQRAKTSQTTTTLPSPWWSRESQLKLLLPQPRTHTTQMEILPLPPVSIRDSHMMIEHQRWGLDDVYTNSTYALRSNLEEDESDLCRQMRAKAWIYC